MFFLPIIPKTCSLKKNESQCVDLSIGTVETVPYGEPAFVTIEKKPCRCAYIINYGIPQGEKGDKGDKGQRGPQGPPGKCDCPIVQGETGCYIFVGTDGKKVKCCLVPDGASGNYRWVCDALQGL